MLPWSALQVLVEERLTCRIARRAAYELVAVIPGDAIASGQVASRNLIIPRKLSARVVCIQDREWVVVARVDAEGLQFTHRQFNGRGTAELLRVHAGENTWRACEYPLLAGVVTAQGLGDGLGQRLQVSGAGVLRDLRMVTRPIIGVFSGHVFAPLLCEVHHTPKIPCD